jgi:hypothetical protein
LDSINKVCTFVTDNLKKSGAQGISLVLTGQAFKNVFLSKLLLEKLNLCERSVQTSSKISDLLQTNPELLKDSTLGLFYLTTCQNEPETIMPKSDFDIVGGSLLSHQNRSMETKL